MGFSRPLIEPFQCRSCKLSFSVLLLFFVWSLAKQYQNDCSAALHLSLLSRWNNVFCKDAIMM